MAEFKRRTLFLSNGKTIRLFGNSIAIGKTLEIGEGYVPNILSCSSDTSTEKLTNVVLNPYKITPEEMMELADYNIRLWMDLKDNIRKHGLDNPKVFSNDAAK